MTKPSQEGATPEDRLRPPRPIRRATVADYEGESPSNDPIPEARDLPLGTEAVAKVEFNEQSEKTTPTLPTISHRITVESGTRSREAKETVVSLAGEECLERTDMRDDKELSERVQTAKKLQATQAEKLRQVQHDKEIVQGSFKRGLIHSPHDEVAGQRTQLLLTNYAYTEKDTLKEDEEDDDEGGKGQQRKSKRHKSGETKQAQNRLQRDNKRDRRKQVHNQSL